VLHFSFKENERELNVNLYLIEEPHFVAYMKNMGFEYNMLWYYKVKNL
jgi:hypothetical protein